MTCRSGKHLFLIFFLVGILLVPLALLSTAFAGQAPTVVTVETSSSDYAWTLRTPAKSGVVEVLLTLRDGAGKPVQGKQITGEVWMPEMPMQGYPLELTFYETGNGEYGALAQHKHGGLWQIKARFTDEQGKVNEAVFDFNLVD